MNVLLSIKPEFVNEIIAGTKKYEYRKRIFKKDVEKVIIYCSKPVGKIIGEFTIEDIICDNPNELWEKTKKYSGIKKDFFNNYFYDKEQGFAIKIKDFIKYDIPINPYNGDNKFYPPQSYMYLK